MDTDSRILVFLLLTGLKFDLFPQLVRHTKSPEQTITYVIESSSSKLELYSIPQLKLHGNYRNTL